jgi:hypothetical protein
VSILRVLTKRGGDDEKTQTYTLRYVEDFFGVSNEVALSPEALAKGKVKLTLLNPPLLSARANKCESVLPAMVDSLEPNVPLNRACDIVEPGS